jgi:uncharacterized protein
MVGGFFVLPRLQFVYIMVIYIMIDWQIVVGFDWDDGNSRKSEDKHQVSQAEAEQVFFNSPLLLLPDPRHSLEEARMHALGMTDTSRPLLVTFTLRSNATLIRIISARPMNRKEQDLLEKDDENDS